MTKILGWVTVAAVMLAAPASAATVSFVGFVEDGDLFSNVAPNAQSGAVDLGVSGSLGGLYADIYAGTDLAGDTAYNSVQSGGSLTYDLIGAVGDAFTFIWGTVDSYNLITLSSGETISGTDVLGLPGNPAAGVSNVIVSITSELGFSSVTLTSGGNSFEHSFNPPELSEVPVPAAGALMLTALGGLGVASRRRKTA